MRNNIVVKSFFIAFLFIVLVCAVILLLVFALMLEVVLQLAAMIAFICISPFVVAEKIAKHYNKWVREI